MTDSTDSLESRLRLGPALDQRAVDTAIDSSAERAWEEGTLDLGWGVAETPIGQLGLAVSRRGLVRVAFSPFEDALYALSEKVSPRILRRAVLTDPVRRQFDQYFAGRRRVFDLAIDWRLVQGFRADVLHELVSVPYGATVSYRELATRVGNPRAVRAVGTAMATNPIPIVVPCHRVLRTGGGLGGYAGGLEAKQFLLELEGESAAKR